MKPTKNGLCHDYTKAELSGKPLTKAEQFVLERVSKGETANLSQFFGFGGRPIRAAFLKKVLTNRFEGINLSGCTINIQNAIILDNLDLTNQIINEEVGLFNCTFTEKVLFDKTIFKKDLDFHDSTFKGLVSLQGLEVDGDLNFGGIKCYQLFLLTYAHIYGLTRGISATFFEPGAALFSNSIFGNGIIISGSKFENACDFSHANVGGNFILCPLKNTITAKLQFSKNTDKYIYYVILNRFLIPKFEENVVNNTTIFKKESIFNDAEIHGA